jgi:ketosteroid isomerase-like protein
MLRQFLDAAGRGDRQVFDAFFANDVIYTRATGAVTSKSEILQNVETLKPTAESKTTYSAEDITVHGYGDTAVVAFRLGARTEQKNGRIEDAYYRNTGTFLRRNGRWQVVAWQATKIANGSGTR